MLNIWLCLLICISEGAIFAAAFVFVSNRYEGYRIPLMAFFVLMEILSVWLLYRNVETVWLFFVHPYISLMIVNIADYFFVKKDRFEKFFLWPFYILPALSGFILVWGWIFKIHALKELIKAL